MGRSTVVRVTGPDGPLGTIDSGDLSEGTGSRVVSVRLDDGEKLRVAADRLARQYDGSFLLITDEEGSGIRAPTDGEEEIVIPVVQEVLGVRKRWVEGAPVRISKVVHQREEVVDEPLMREEVEVERVAVNRIVEGPVATRHEGDIMIVPILEEVLVVEKRLMLKEELHIRRRRLEESRPQRVTLRTEEAHVERLDGGATEES